MIRGLGLCLVPLVLAGCAADIRQRVSTAVARSRCQTQPQSLPSEALIKACTDAINSGALTGEALAGARLGRGVLHLRRNAFELARADLEEDIRLRPLNPGGLLWRGVLKLRTGDAAGAEADADAALRLDPGEFGAYELRGQARARQGRDQAARADLEQAMRISPGARSFMARGMLRDILGDLAGAEADLTEGLRLDPAATEALASRGMVRLRRGRLAEATADFDAVLRNAPVALAIAGRCIARHRSGQRALALVECEFGLLVEAEWSGLLHAVRGGVALLDNENDIARTVLDESLRRQPWSVHGLVLRSLLRRRQGDHAGAERDSDKARRLNIHANCDVLGLFGPGLVE